MGFFAVFLFITKDQVVAKYQAKHAGGAFCQTMKGQ